MLRGLIGSVVALGGLVLAGCAGGGAEQKAEVKAARPAGPQVSCFAGVGELAFADGRKLPAGEKVVRRTVDALNRRILEEVLELDPAGERPPQVWKVLLRVEQNARPDPAAKEPHLRCAWFFRAKEETDRFEGLGCLEGEAWAWTAWTATYRLASRGSVLASDRLEADGLHSSQRVLDDMDRPAVQVEHLLAPVALQVCSERLPPPGR